VRTEILQLTSLLTAEEPKLAEVSAGKEEAERTANERAEQLSILEVELAQATHRANDAHIRFVQLQSEQQNLTNEHSRLEEAIRTSDLTIEKRRSDRVRAEEDIEQLEKDLFDLRTALDTQRGQHNESAERAKIISDELSARRTAVQTMIEKIREERHTFESSMTATHEYEVKLSELKLKSENVIQRAKEEFEINLEQKQFEDAQEFSMTDAREEVRAMKQKLRGLGAVNLLAYEEFQQEKERMEFLQHQRQDLTESEKTLVQTIAEINETAQTKFLETFSQIRTNFSDIFRTLFTEGDQADISLSDEVEDPLEAPIIITAKPHGKRPQSIDLLSAGEKTLTAIALLFSIYLVKPSPFCILDEVDAPLDDANIDRFIRLLRRFSDNTQFIVVTHNKRTMEAADTMYGVTMEEEGVSKIVSVRFTETKDKKVEPVAIPAE
jgi:chromosome segregation protein